MKKKLLAVLLAIVMVTSVAVSVPILAAGSEFTDIASGLRFQIDDSVTPHTVNVGYQTENSASGDVIIPSTATDSRSGTVYTVTGILNSAFNGNTKITSVVMPDSITTMGSAVFAMASSLTFVKLSANITQIPEYTFNGCFSLVTADIPAGVTRILDHAFNTCQSLSSITLPESLTEIGKDSFIACKSVTTITIPKNLSMVGNGAFAGCSSLTSIEFDPNAVISKLSNSMFLDCTSLTNVTIPASITMIDGYAFKGCKNLETVSFLGATPPAFGTQSFDNIKPGALARVPDGSIGNYDINAYPFKDGIPLLLATQLPTPVANPAGGPTIITTATPQSVTITCSEPDVIIRFTTDGTEPTQASAIYPNAPIMVGKAGSQTILRAKAYKQGFFPSEIMTEEYNFIPPIPECFHPDWLLTIEPPTVTADGLKTETCTICGYQKTEVIPKLPPPPAPTPTSPRSSDTAVTQYEILALYTEGGKISPYNVVYVDEGADQTFTLQPDEGYRIEKLLLDGKPVSFTDRQFTITDVHANHELAAYYVKIDVKPEPPKPTPMPQTGDSLLEPLF